MQHRHASSYVIRRLKLSPILKFGFLLGAAAGILPSLTATIVVMRTVSALRGYLEGLRNVTEPLPVFDLHISFDFVDLLGQADNLQRLQTIDDHAWLFGPTLFLTVVLGCAITVSLAALATAIVYNMLAARVGGFEVDLEEASLRR